MADPVEIEFKKETINKLLTKSFKDSKTKVSGDAVLLMCDILKVFVEEASRRALKQSTAEDSEKVDVEHFEKVLPQLLLDF
ncbi:centromere protein X isoform X2 [Sardina pilchardus]|uniref:centromere protein X isoform X2 n=1 Tax=Sardina pilchardus TaxID=27697 RepID=UPI002E140E13